MAFNRLITLYTICSLLPSTVAAQSVPDQQPADQNERQETRKVLEKKAFALLNEVIAEGQTLRLAENRIRVQSKAADLLWPLDKRRARALFGEAAHSLGELTANLDEADQQQYYAQVNNAAQLRQEMLSIVSRRDPGLAREFLQFTRQPPTPGTESSNNRPDNELRMELNLASQIATSDPNEALKIGEKCLDKGVSSELTNLLSQLQASGSEAAPRLAIAIVQKLRSENLAANEEATNVALSLLQMGRPLDASASSQAPDQAGPTNAMGVLDEMTYRELMDKLAATALQMSIRNNPPDWTDRSNAQDLLTNLETMMPEVEKYIPARASSLRRKMAEFDRTLDPQARMWNEYRRQEQSGTVDDLLHLAAQAPAEMRNSLYQQVAWKAFTQGDIDRARLILSENISSPVERRQLLANLEREALWQVSNQGSLGETLRRLQSLSSNEDRVLALVQLANNAAGRGDKRTALQLVEEAHALVSSRAENILQLNAQLQVAAAYASFEDSRGFQILEAVADQLNELSAASAVLAGFDYQQNFKDGELVLQGGSYLTNLIQQYASSLESLARTDFDRAKLTAERLQRAESRIAARLSIAQAALQ